MTAPHDARGLRAAFAAAVRVVRDAVGHVAHRAMSLVLRYPLQTCSLAILFALTSGPVSFYWGTTFDWSLSANWEALSSIATFAAVLVALAPILLDRVQRKRQANGVRRRLKQKLSVFKPQLAAQSRGANWRARGAELSTGQFLKEFADLESLMQHTDLITDDESDVLTLCVTRLRCCGLDGSPRPASSAEDALASVTDAIDILDERERGLPKRNQPYLGQWVR
jgi:hypothetical protein